LNTTTTPIDLLLIIAALSASVTPDGVIAKVRQMLPGLQSAKTVVFSLVSAMSARSAIETFMTKAGFALEDDWKITQGRADGGRSALNFSMFTLFGHMVCTLPDNAWTPRGKIFLEKYRSSLGGATDIISYGINGRIEGKMDNKADGGAGRGKILQKWAQILQGWDMRPYQNIVSNLLPDVIVPSASALPVIVSTPTPDLASVSSVLSGPAGGPGFISRSWTAAKKLATTILSFGVYLFPFFFAFFFSYLYIGKKIWSAFKSTYGAPVLFILGYIAFVFFMGDQIKTIVKGTDFDPAPEFLTEPRSAAESTLMSFYYVADFAVDTTTSSAYTSLFTHFLGGIKTLMNRDSEYVLWSAKFSLYMLVDKVVPWFYAFVGNMRNYNTAPEALRESYSKVKMASSASYDLLFTSGRNASWWQDSILQYEQDTSKAEQDKSQSDEKASAERSKKTRGEERTGPASKEEPAKAAGPIFGPERAPKDGL
jgi:hypothetical protein